MPFGVIMAEAAAVGEGRVVEQVRALSFCRGVMEGLWLILAFSIPLFFYSGSNNVFVLNKVLLFRFLVVLMVAFWVVEGALGGWRGEFALWKRRPLLLPVLLLSLFYLISTAASLTPRNSFWGSYMRMGGTYTFLCLLALFIIVSHHLRTKVQIQRLLLVLLLSSGIVSLYGVLQYYGYDPLVKVPIYGQRVSSTTGNPIFLGGYLILVIPLALAVLLGYGGWRRHKTLFLSVSLVFLLGLQSVALWFTQSRGPFLGLVMGVFLLLLLLALVERRKYLLWASLFLFLLASVLLVWMSLPAASFEPVERLAPDSRILSPAQLQSEGAQSRFLMWRSVLKLVVAPPEIASDRLRWLRPLIGYGPETLEATFPAVYPPRLGQLEGRGAIVDRAHNRFLDLAVTVGLLGLGSYLFLVASFLFYAWRCLRKAPLRRERLLIIGLMSAIMGSLVEGFFGLDSVEVEVGFWLNLALLVGVGSIALGDSLTSDIRQSSLPWRNRVRETLALSLVFLLVVFGFSTALPPFRADIEARKGLNSIVAGDLKGALPPFSRATELAPGTALYWSYLGQTYFRLAQGVEYQEGKAILLKGSAQALEEVIRLEPLYPSHYALSAMVHTYWAERVEPGQWEKVMRLYQQATRLSPYEAYLYNEWALALMKKGEFPQAGEKLRHSLSLDPEYGQTHFFWGIWLARMGQPEEAIREITLALRLDMRVLRQAYEWMGALALGGGLAELGEPVGKAVLGSPQDWAGHSLLATLYFHQGRMEASLQERKQALALVPQEKRESLAQLFKLLNPP